MSKTPTIKSKSVTKSTSDEIKSIPNYKPEKAGDNQAQRTKHKRLNLRNYKKLASKKQSSSISTNHKQSKSTKRVSKRKAKTISNQAAFINGEINDEGRHKKSKNLNVQKLMGFLYK